MDGWMDVRVDEFEEGRWSVSFCPSPPFEYKRFREAKRGERGKKQREGRKEKEKEGRKEESKIV